MASLHSSQMDLVSDLRTIAIHITHLECWSISGSCLISISYCLHLVANDPAPPFMVTIHFHSLGKDSDPTYPYCLSQPQQFPSTPISQYDKTSTCKCENDDVEFLSDFLVYCSHFCTVRSRLEVPDGEGWGRQVFTNRRSSVGRFPIVFPCFPLMRRLGQGRGTVGSLHVVG